jgi:DNA-binding NarL/FixJ family response regulator
MRDERGTWKRCANNDECPRRDDGLEEDAQTADGIIRILLVDGNEVVRRGISIALEIVDGMRVVGETSSGAQALWACAELTPDVVLMEIQLNDQDGVEFIRQVRQQFPRIQIVVLTSDPTPDIRRQAESAGVNRYLQKYTTVDELIAAIRTTHLQGDAHSNRSGAE